MASDTSSASSLLPPLEYSRLSIPFIYRLPATTISAGLVGSLLGITHGGQTAGLRFRAENAHRLPSSSTGWYLYHKSKNYNMALGGVKEGFKMGAKLSFWVGAFFTMEEVIDRTWGKQDFRSTTAAGWIFAGGFSAWCKFVADREKKDHAENVLLDKFPLHTAARTTKLGLLSGLGFGLVQDALSLAKGNRLDYVDFILRKYRRSKHAIDQLIKRNID